MHCIYINSDREISRYVSVQKSFEAYADPDWPLHRISAVLENTLPRRYWGGSLPIEEKARFASHVGALELAVTLPGDAMILEDDMSFGQCSTEMIWDALDTARHASWDLLFADTCLIGTSDTKIRLPLETAAKGTPEDSRMLAVSEGKAYVVSESAKRRLLGYLNTLPMLNTPYHLMLRDLIEQEILSARAAMPLTASPSYCTGACPTSCALDQ